MERTDYRNAPLWQQADRCSGNGQFGSIFTYQLADSASIRLRISSATCSIGFPAVSIR